jgi:hypothetical protein
LSQDDEGGRNTSRRRAGWFVVAAGIVFVAAAQALSPVAAPLFDGLIVLGPYHFLNPGTGQTGSPTSATVTEPLVSGASPGFNAATTEPSPQAQLIAAPGAFALGPGSTAVTVTISPIPPPAPSTVGPILGNVYRFTVTDQAGNALATKPGTDVTIVLRAPDATTDAVFAEYSAGAWQQIPSSSSGTPGFFIAMTGGGGEYGLVAAPAGFGLLQAGILAIVVTAVLAVGGSLLIRRRRVTAGATSAASKARSTSSTPSRATGTSASRKKRRRR